MSPRPSPRPSKLLRQALRRAFPSVAVFDAFCLDHFPAIYQQFSPGMDRTIKENLLLQQADPDVLEPLLPPAAELDLARPDPLLSRVIAATRLRYRRLQDPQSAEDPQVTLLDAPPSLRALLQVSFSLSERPTHLGVVVLAEPPAQPQLDVIRDALDAHGLRTGQALPCLVVCTQRGFVPTPALQAACDALPLRLYSLEEYEGLIDFSRLLPKQTHELGQSIDYPPALYVDQRLEYCEDGSFRFDQHPPAESAIDKVVSWLADPSRPRFVLLIGDFGHGKTFLLREVCRRLGDPQHAPAVPLIPLYCELRELEKARRLEELLVQYLARHREQLRSPDPDALLHMLSLGRVVLFFDGFDELALRTTYDRAAEHLNTLLQAVSAPGSLAKVVLTSRTQHFLSDVQLGQELARATRTVLGDRLAHLPIGIGRLPPFDRGQIHTFLRNWLKSDAQAAERLRLIDDVKDLLGLSTNPRLLSFIAALPEKDLRAARDGSGEVTAASLYQALLSRWLRRESERTDLGRVPVDQGVAARFQALTQLALRLWEKTDRTADVADLGVDAQRHLHDLTLAEAAHEVGARTLLSRDAQGRFAFFHESILEWLVARAAADELRRGTCPLLGRQEASALLCEFFQGHAGADPAATWAEEILLSSDAELGPHAPTLKHNAQGVLTRLHRPLPESQQLAGHDLHARSFSHQRLIAANFTGANLRGAKLYKADLRRANFTRADLTGADLMGADLRGATFDHAILRRCRLLGARLDPNALAHLPPESLYGSAGPAPTPPQGMGGQAPDVITNNKLYTTLDCGLCYSPDGRLLAVARGPTVTLYAADSGEALRVLVEHEGEVHGLCFSPDGRILASGSTNCTVRLWEPCTGILLRLLSGHEGLVHSVAFSPTGGVLASGSQDGTLRLWQADSGTPLRVLHAHKQGVTSVAFSPDGQLLASGGLDFTLRLWQAASGALLRILQEAIGPVTSMTFSPDGRLLASTAWDGTVRLWQVDSGAGLQVLQGQEHQVNRTALSPDGRTLASGTGDHTVALWRVASRAGLGLKKEPAGRVGSVAYSPDGRTLAARDESGAVQLWQADSQAVIPVSEVKACSVTSVAFSPDGSQLASAMTDHTVRLWQPESGAKLQILMGHERSIQSVAFSPDGRMLASGAWDGTVRLWQPDSGATLRVLKGNEGTIQSVAFSPDGRMLASGARDGTVRLWQPDSGATLRVLKGHELSVNSVAFSPNGRMLASGALDNTVWLWQPDSGATLRVLKGHEDSVYSVAFSPDGRMLAAGSIHGTVCLWQPDSGAPLRVLKGQEGSVYSIAFAPDGRMLASGARDGTVRLWQPESGALVRILRGHAGPVTSLAFSPDGRVLASGSDDGTVRLWEVATGRCLAWLVAAGESWAVGLPDGRYKAVGSLPEAFWHVIGLCRFEVGELDEFVPGLRLPPEQSLHALPPFDPPWAAPAPALPPPADAVTQDAAPPVSAAAAATMPDAAPPLSAAAATMPDAAPPVSAAASPTPDATPPPSAAAAPLAPASAPGLPATGSGRRPATGTILAGLGAASSLALYALLPEAHYIALGCALATAVYLSLRRPPPR